MPTIYYGTNNSAKINYFKKVSENQPLTITGVNEIKNINHDINESGKEPLENARIKAWHYFWQINKPVFSIDSGLFFDGVEYEDQPGTFVRRVKGKTLTDSGMIEYYSGLAAKYGGEITGYYKNAVCIIISPEKITEYSDNTINSETFILSSVPHKTLVEGWPLDSLSKEIKSGKYYYDLELTGSYSNPIGTKAEREFLRLLNEAMGIS